jgi:hypothetical protein
MIEHTLLPWKYYSGSHGIYSDRPGAPKDEKAIAILCGPRGDEEIRAANAEYILRAVRVFEALKRFPDLPDEIRAMMEATDAG